MLNIKNGKKLDLEFIINSFYDNKDKIINWLLIFFLVFFTTLIGIFAYKSYSNYDTINKKIKTMAIVHNNSIISYIKKNNLRSVTSITDTVNLIWNKKYDYKTVWKYLLLAFLEKDQWWNSEVIKSQLYYGVVDNIWDITDDKMKEDISIIDNDSELLSSIWDEAKVVKLKRNFDNIIKENSSFIKEINSFPKNIKNKDIASVANKLYVYEFVFIEKTLKLEKEKYEWKMKKYQAPYANFLVDVFYPNINIWSNKFSWIINVDVFGSDYLKKANYIDINLINYWTNFFKYAYRWKNYQWKANEIEDISLGKLKQENNKDVKDIVALPIQVRFWVQTDSSFYGLISKLTSTSNIENIMLLSEFTYNLWSNIKENVNDTLSTVDNNDKPLWYRYMVSLLNKCENWDIRCNALFGCKNSVSSSKIKKIISASKYNDSLANANDVFRQSMKICNFDKSTFGKYMSNKYDTINDIDKLIWARLTDCIKGWYCDDILTYKKSGDIVRKTIEDFAWCNKDDLLKCSSDIDDGDCNSCRYKFANKFNTNYFVVYTLIWDLDKLRKYWFISRLKDVYTNIPGIVKLWQFKFSKLDNPVFSYEADVNLNVYYKYISNDDLNKILSYIWKDKCSVVTKWRSWSIDIAKKYVSDKINNLYKLDEDAKETYDLQVLDTLIKEKQSVYKKSDNLTKILIDLQIYRIFVERNYCQE